MVYPEFVRRLGRVLLFVGVSGACLFCFGGCSGSADKPSAESKALEIIDVQESGSHSAEVPPIKRALETDTRFAVVTANNLFHPERKYEEDEAPDDGKDTDKTQKPTVEIPNLRLIGTLTLEDEEAYAFIKETKGKENRTRKFSTGDEIGEYLITLIEPNRVTFKKGEEVAVLKLKPMEGQRRTAAAQKNRGRTTNPRNRAGQGTSTNPRVNRTSSRQPQESARTRQAQSNQRRYNEKREEDYDSDMERKESLAGKLNTKSSPSRESSGRRSSAQSSRRSTRVCGR